MLVELNYQWAVADNGDILCKSLVCSDFDEIIQIFRGACVQTPSKQRIIKTAILGVIQSIENAATLSSYYRTISPTS